MTQPFHRPMYIQRVGRLARVVSILKSVENTHPFVPVRLKELREYSRSPEYEKLLRGEYERDVLGLHEGGLRKVCACGHEFNAKLEFCSECGRPADLEATTEAEERADVCSKCGTSLTEEMKFCPHCGSKHDSTAAGNARPRGIRLFNRQFGH